MLKPAAAGTFPNIFSQWQYNLQMSHKTLVPVVPRFILTLHPFVTISFSLVLSEYVALVTATLY